MVYKTVQVPPAKMRGSYLCFYSKYGEAAMGEPYALPSCVKMVYVLQPTRLE